ncbi:MAG TPA: GlsB/YeaQ/YmgE family stress response membrane protein [Candidatus Methylomirabilis sp.]|nr:GlsB/YeaQ/YmgE family stress response membrane protein [Candidatus Methylomirabilis sp.]
MSVVVLHPFVLLSSRFETRAISIYFPHGFWYWLLIGLIAGWLAGKIARGRGFGCIADVILGIVGSYVGGWIFLKIGLFGGGFWYSLAAATVGAIVLVGIAHILFGSGDRN